MLHCRLRYKVTTDTPNDEYITNTCYHYQSLSHPCIIMWWKIVLLTLYLAVLFVLSRILEAVAYYEGGGYISSKLLDPMSLSVRKLKAILDQRGVSYTGVVESSELKDLVKTSG